MQTEAWKPELVAPAGNQESLVAAVENGADAVYLGVKQFNARQRADNFDVKDLPEAVRYAHLRGVRIYLTLNTLIKNSEINQALDIAYRGLEAGVDALIVQDPGFLLLLRRHFPGARIHASTQMNIQNTAAAGYLKSLGVKRAVLARELSLSEIAAIKRNAGLEIEVFIHGALCFSCSGQCLFSSIVGRRSGNRGLCAQPCRLSYKLMVKDRVIELPYSYLLSTRDLMALPLLGRLIKARIDAFKIEGRLKSAEYVALVTGVYRREIERALKLGHEYYPLEESVEILNEAFSRGFTAGYLEGQRGNELMSYTRPNNRGVFIGRVVFVDQFSGRVGIALQKELQRGDILEFWVTRKGRVVQEIKDMYRMGREVEELEAGRRAEVVVEHNRHLIKPGDRVYRVFNSKLARQAEQSFKKPVKSRFPLNLVMHIDNSGEVHARAEAGGETVEFRSSVKLEPAKTHPTTVEIVRNQLSKLGGTPYLAAEFRITLPEGGYIPVRELNRIRRQLVSELDAKRLASWSKPDFNRPAEVSLSRKNRHRVTPALVVKTGYADTASEAIDEGADIVVLRYPPFRSSPINQKDIDQLAEKARSRGVYFGLAFPEIAHDADIEKLLQYAGESEGKFSYFLADNLGLALELSSRGYPVMLDYHVNVFNSFAADCFFHTSIRAATASVELSSAELKQLARTSMMPLAVLVYGDVEIMSAEHCILTAAYAEGVDYDVKARPCVLLAREGRTVPRICEETEYSLVDRKGYGFPAQSDENCRSYLYNSACLCGADFIHDLYLSGYTYFRADILTPRTRANSRRVIAGLRRIIDELKKGRRPEIDEEKICGSGFTRGHFRRGVI